ncbi:hypothetical protein Scep_020025 [Stephania cephalantha]|uniref:Uncharacterized protein n=1 Tax=Stephania cephalantha TaxID=152367 RepID=A0AAP0IBU3_9MAGN
MGGYDPYADPTTDRFWQLIVLPPRPCVGQLMGQFVDSDCYDHTPPRYAAGSSSAA